MRCCCTPVCVLIGILIAQLVTVLIRQTFDIMGLQWTAIVANFCQITAVILGLFGAYRTKPRLLAVYSFLNVIWMGWNIYVILLYFGVGGLNIDDHSITLNLRLSDSVSWFRSHPFGCATSPTTAAAIETCFLTYSYIESFQSSIQILLSSVGLTLSCYSIGIMREEESFKYKTPINSAKNGQVIEETNLYTHPLQPLVGDSYA